MSRTATIITAVASAALVASAAAPASAARDTFTDKRNDLRGAFDIQSVHVRNAAKWVTVRSKHRNLRYNGHAPTGVQTFYFDTRPRRPGPEFAVGSTINFDSEYSFMRIRRWKLRSFKPCKRLRYHVNYRRDVVATAVPQSCLGGAKRVRISVRTSQHGRHGQQRFDWAPKRRHSYPAVARG